MTAKRQMLEALWDCESYSEGYHNPNGPNPYESGQDHEAFKLGQQDRKTDDQAPC